MRGIELKQIRKLHKLTQEDLSKMLGVDRRTIINYEKSDDIPPPIVKLIHSMFSEVKRSESDSEKTRSPDVGVLERLEVFAHSINTSAEDILNKIGVDLEYFSQINMRLITDLLLLNPSLNANWLFTGLGPKKRVDEAEYQRMEDLVEINKGIIRDKDLIIEYANKEVKFLEQLLPSKTKAKQTP